MKFKYYAGPWEVSSSSVTVVESHCPGHLQKRGDAARLRGHSSVNAADRPKPWLSGVVSSDFGFQL